MKGQGSAVSFWETGAGKSETKTGAMPGSCGSIVPRGSGWIGAATQEPKIRLFYSYPSMSPIPAQPPASYEAALAELEKLVGQIESGQLPLEELLAGYQRGAQLLQFCRDRLQAVESQIKVLDEGVLKPWTQE
jgi:exodeoxyribonuclease VII small subunit